MSLEEKLARELVRRHPERASVALEALDPESAARQLEAAPAHEAARVLRRMSPIFAAGVLEHTEVDRITQLVDELPLDVAARLVRRLPADRVDAVLDRLGSALARSLRSLLRFREGSAGAFMDPDVLALPDNLLARDALVRVRESAENARYNVYVVDSEQRLVGVVNLRELLLARPGARLADFMTRNPDRLDARADRSVVVTHPGWRGVHSLPVVDEQDCYLGAVRYRTLRALEEELFAHTKDDQDAVEALGRLFSTGVGGLVEALAATRRQP
jgi:magnesium transporter